MAQKVTAAEFKQELKDNNGKIKDKKVEEPIVFSVRQGDDFDQPPTEIKDCKLTSISFDGLRYPSLSLIDCDIDTLLITSSIEMGSLEIKKCKIGEIKIDESSLQNLDIKLDNKKSKFALQRMNQIEFLAISGEFETLLLDSFRVRKFELKKAEIDTFSAIHLVIAEFASEKVQYKQIGLWNNVNFSLSAFGA
jgi:hypothetical protein